MRVRPTGEARLNVMDTELDALYPLACASYPQS